MFTKTNGATKPGNVKSGKGVGSVSDPSTLGIVFMAFLCAVLPLDISQLSFAILGAVLYALLQKSDNLKPKKQRISVVAEAAPQSDRIVRAPKQKACSIRPDASAGAQARQGPAPIGSTELRVTPSVKPIVAPTFQSDSLEGEVQELLVQITPTNEAEQIVNQLVQIVRQTLQKMIPEVEVHGFVYGNLTVGKAFGVAVPEVEIVANVSPEILFRRLHSNSNRDSSSQIDPKKLQKAAIRACCDQLVSAGGLKFRRSAFRLQEPKVTLLAPASLGLFSEAIPIDFSVNAATPFYNTALLTECGRMDSRAKELVLLVKRWAKDRGICHAAKGHLSPYVWSLLTIYYLQVGEEDPLLPPLEQFKISSGLIKGKKATTGSKQPTWTQADATEPKKSVAELFKDFVRFFESQFDWHSEAISIQSGRRAPPGLDVPRHIIVSDNNSAASQVGPTIEDPFHVAQNLGDGMNGMSLARLKEELSRAETLCTRGASLSELLEPWVPAELAEGDEQGELVVDQAAAKKLQEMPTKREDWRRDAKEAQAAMAPSSSTPPWRRR